MRPAANVRSRTDDVPKLATTCLSRLGAAYDSSATARPRSRPARAGTWRGSRSRSRREQPAEHVGQQRVPHMDRRQPRLGAGLISGTRSRTGNAARFDNLAFGQPNAQASRYADDVLHGYGARPYSWEFSTGIQRELKPGFAVNGAYYRRWYGNFSVTNNLPDGLGLQSLLHHGSREPESAGRRRLSGLRVVRHEQVRRDLERHHAGEEIRPSAGRVRRSRSDDERQNARQHHAQRRRQRRTRAREQLFPERSAAADGRIDGAADRQRLAPTRTATCVRPFRRR